MSEARPADMVAFTTTSIQVNIDDLSSFRTFLCRELDANLQPGLNDVTNAHSLGVRFGQRNPGHHVGEATTAYHGALDISTSNLHEYVRIAENLTQTIYVVLGRYRAADLTAAGTAQRLDKAFSDVLKAQVTDASSELTRETYRASR